MHAWDQYNVETQWLPRNLRFLIVGENPGNPTSEYFYSVPQNYSADEVVVRRALLHGLRLHGLIAEATLPGFRDAGFLFDHAIRCHLSNSEVIRERQKARRYSSGRVADPEHLRKRVADSEVVWVMGHLASNAVANVSYDFPKQRRLISMPPYPTGISSKFFVSEYLTWRNEADAPAICEAFARFAEQRSAYGS